MRLVNLAKEKLLELSIKQKRILLASIALLVALCVLVIILISSNSVKGKYDFISIKINDNTIFVEDSGYMDILGVDNGKKSTFYIEMSDSTARLTGYIYTVQKNKGYSIYKFDVVSQSGTLLEDLDYFKFQLYSDRDMIEVKSSDATLYFYKK